MKCSISPSALPASKQFVASRFATVKRVASQDSAASSVQGQGRMQATLESGGDVARLHQQHHHHHHQHTAPSDDLKKNIQQPQKSAWSVPNSPSTLAASIQALRDASHHTPKLNPAPQQADAGQRRKKKPSPLQQFSTPAPKLYGKDPLSPTSTTSRSSNDAPRSPRERLEAFLAPQGSSSSTTPDSARSASISAPTHAQQQKPSAPTIPPLGPSPPASPTSMLPNNTQPRPVMARNPSIESTVSAASSSVAQSSRSNSVNAGKTSMDGNSGVPDIAGLIAAAGSAEAALQSLWKDRQSTLSHNSQLWRVVEKQRTMILGLNKDLERALKDKERYRKKLKELTAQDSKKANPLNRTDSALDREDSESPAPQPEERQPTVDEFPQVPGHSLSAVRPPVAPSVEEIRTIIRTDTTSTVATQSPQDSNFITESVGDHTSIEASPITTSPQVERPQERSQSVDVSTHAHKSPAEQQKSSPIVVLPPAIAKPPSPRERATPSLITRLQPPTLAVIEATPLADSGSFPSPPTRTFKKPIPAPLNLSQSNISQPIVLATKVEEVLVSPLGQEDEPVMQLPTAVDRGRRRTREDDDKAREVIAIQEEEARSLSKKSTKSKSKSKPPAPIEPPAVSQEIYFPTNADYGSSPTVPTSQTQTLKPANMLSPTSSDTSSSASFGKTIVAPLLSPGLPTSPRPIDRPLNQPSPRLPKASLASPPMSPRHVPSMPNLTAHSRLNNPAYQLSSPSAYPAPLFSKPPSQPPPSFPIPPTPEQQSPTKSQPSQAPQEKQQPLQIPQEQLRPLQAPQEKQQPPQAPQEKLQPPQMIQDAGRSTPTLVLPADSPGSETIFRGFVSDQYPGLLLPPNALPLIDVRVFSSRMRPSRHSILIARPNEEDPVFLLGIYSRADGKQLWRLEKTILSLPALHQEIKSLCSFDGKLPDRSLFSGHAPAKIDARRAALNAYFDILLDTPLTEKAALTLCQFFSRDVIGAEPEEAPATRQLSPNDPIPVKEGPKAKPKREGYLTKRGKNFGGWKARFFVLESPELRYYDSPSGPQIGIIKLSNAQIGKQSQQQAMNQSPAGREEDVDNQYRHAFLILEPKKKDSSSHVRHVLCAESDEERDAWVEALMKYVDVEEKPQENYSDLAKRPSTSQGIAPPMRTEPTNPATNLQLPLQQPPPQQQRNNAPLIQEQVDPNVLQAFSYENAVAAEAPVVGPSYKEYPKQQQQQQPQQQPLPSPTLVNNGFGHTAQKISADKITISGPTNGSVIQDLGLWGNKTPAKEKKRSIFAGFRGRSSSDLNSEQKLNPNSMPEVKSRAPLSRPVFGIPLSEAVELTQPMGVDIPLPAAVYRCIEYLQTRGAVQEEGIFRLSGSNIVIKGLRDRFNTEGDVRLLDGDYYDVHAVASLLKLYLRELPVSILTRELHLEFLKVLGTIEITCMQSSRSNFCRYGYQRTKDRCFQWACSEATASELCPFASIVLVPHRHRGECR